MQEGRVKIICSLCGRQVTQDILAWGVQTHFSEARFFRTDSLQMAFGVRQSAVYAEFTRRGVAFRFAATHCFY
jgi:hypothetical protein